MREAAHRPEPLAVQAKDLARTLVPTLVAAPSAFVITTE
jgi:hypothetical protein